MALNLNRVEVIGNLTRDPELRYTPNGQAVVSFAVATNRRYPDQAGNWVDAEAEFHDVVAWAKTAEGINQALKKGDRVYISGRLQTRSWEGQDGARRNKTEIVLDTIIGPDQVGRASFGGDNSGPVVRNQPAPGPSAPSSPAPSSTPPSSTSPTEATEPAASPDNAANDDEIKIEDIPF